MQKRRVIITDKTQISGGMEEAQARYGYGRATIKHIAEDAGAIIRIGRTVRYNFQKIDAYINSLSDGGK